MGVTVVCAPQARAVDPALSVHPRRPRRGAASASANGRQLSVLRQPSHGVKGAPTRRRASTRVAAFQQGEIEAMHQRRVQRPRGWKEKASSSASCVRHAWTTRSGAENRRFVAEAVSSGGA